MNLSEKLISLRRELHMYPEIGFDLPRTHALVRRELDDIGIGGENARECGKSSLYVYINPEKASRYTIALRADMDALPITERSSREYASRIPGAMHACGHDAHTAIMLGAARLLFERKDKLACAVKLLFQANEEGYDTGAKYVAEAGFTDDVDIIAGLHVGNDVPSGYIGLCPGAAMAGSHTVKVDFFGKPAHATQMQLGADSIAMAVEAYQRINAMNSRFFSADDKRVVFVGVLRGGEAPNIVCAKSHMELTVRAFDIALDKKIIDMIYSACRGAASDFRGSCEIDSAHYTFPVINDAFLCASVERTARAVVGKDRFVVIPPQMGSEDFSFYQQKIPGIFFRLGTRGAGNSEAHTDTFDLDESQLTLGADMFLGFVRDNMNNLRSEDKR